MTPRSWIPTLTLAFGQGVSHCADRCISFRFKRDRDRRHVHKTFVSACLYFAYRIDRQLCTFERALARQKITRSNEVSLLKNAARISENILEDVHRIKQHRDTSAFQVCLLISKTSANRMESRWKSTLNILAFLIVAHWHNDCSFMALCLKDSVPVRSLAFYEFFVGIRYFGLTG